MSKLLLRDLSPGTSYSIQLRSKNEDTTSDWSPMLEFGTTVDTRLPEEPTSVTWTSVGRSFLATWVSPTTLEDGSPLNNLASYEIKITYSGTDVYYIVTGNRFDFTYEMNEAKFGTARSPLSMSIRAVTTTGYKSAEAFPTPNPASNPVPGAVTIGTIKNSVEAIQIPWTAPADLDLVGFNVYASQTNAFTPGPGNKVDQTNSLTYTHSTTSTAPWYFHVRAFDIFGQESTSSQVTGTATAAVLVDTTAPSDPPSVLTAMGFDVARQQAYVDVTWTPSASTDVRSYTIRWATAVSNWNYITVGDDVTATNIDVPASTDIFVAVQAVDFVGNKSGWENSATYPHMSLSDTTAPLTPAIATANANQTSIQVSHSNLDNAAAAMSPDTSYYEVFAKRVDSGWTYDNSTFIGRLPKTLVTSLTFPLPEASQTGSTEQWYVRVRAVDKAGNVSAISASATAGTSLVGSINILEATITGAKITNLEADKLVAGDGIIQSLTIGNATNDGDVHSYDYLTGLTGWRIGSNSSGESELEINDGLIKARAVELRKSFNIMPASLSEFNARPSYYLDKLNVAGATYAVDSGGRNGQALIISTVTNPWTIRIGTEDNVEVEANKSYIISFYAKASVATSMDASLTFDNDVLIDPVILTPSISVTTAYQRFTVLHNGTSDSLTGLSFSGISTGVDIFIDQIMFEEKVGALNEASRYEPPSFTTIDGGQIRTGSIQSNVEVGGRPAWFINTEGDAELASAKIYGILTVGTPDDSIPSRVESGNYVPSTTGWRINSDGTAFLNDVDIRGAGTLNTIQVDKGLSVVSPTSEPASIDVSNGTVFNIGGLLAPPATPNAYISPNESISFTGTPAGSGTMYGPVCLSTDHYMAESGFGTPTATTITQDYESAPAAAGLVAGTNTSATRTTSGWANVGTGAVSIANTNASNSAVTVTDTQQQPTVGTGSTATSSVVVNATISCYVVLSWGSAQSVVTFTAGQTKTISVTKSGSGVPTIYAYTFSLLPVSEIFRFDTWTTIVTSPNPTITLHKYNSAGVYTTTGIPYPLNTAFPGITQATVQGFSHDGSNNFWVAVKADGVTGAVKLLKFSDAVSLNHVSNTSFTEPDSMKYGYKPNHQVRGTNLYTAYCLNGDIEENLVRNPSIETNATLWTATGSGPPVLAEVSDQLRISGPAASGGNPAAGRGAIPTLSTNTFVSGDNVYLTMDVKAISSKMNMAQVSIWYQTAAGADLGSAKITAVPINTSTYTTITLNNTMVTSTYPTAAKYRIQVLVYGSGANLTASEQLAYVDNVRVVNNGPRARKAPLTFANGDTAGWTWAGTTYLSNSSRTLDEGVFIVEKRALAALTTITQTNDGHQMFSDITGFYTGTGDYAGGVSGTAETYSVTRIQDLVNYPIGNNYGLGGFDYINAGTSGLLSTRQAFYTDTDGMGFSTSTGHYYVYARASNAIRKLPHLFDGCGTLSIALAYYDANATGGTHETTISKIKNMTYFPRNRIEISGIVEPFVPGAVAATDSPTYIRAYIGSDSTTDITKMARVWSTAMTPGMTIPVDSLTVVPRTGTIALVPGNITFPAPAYGTTFGQPSATNTFSTVAGFVPAVIKSSNDYFSVDGNGTGRISGLSFSTSGLVLQTLGGTSGRITTNTGGFELNHDGTGTWDYFGLASADQVKDTGWLTPTLSGTWANYGGTFATAKYRKIGKCVFLKGLVRNGAVSSTIFNIPVGYRPLEDTIFIAALNSNQTGAQTAGTAHTHPLTDTGVRLNLSPAGNLSHDQGGTGYVSLNGIFWFVD